jgi:Icc-related predicted phosphoesterase
MKNLDFRSANQKCELPQSTPYYDIGSISESKIVNFLFASNVNEDWTRLSKLLNYGEKVKADLVVLTKLFCNPLNIEDQSAYLHAFQHVTSAFDPHEFSDLQQFIESFRQDPSTDIITRSAKKILSLIEKGKEKIKNNILNFKLLTRHCNLKIVIIPGQFENLDVLKNVDEEFFCYYVNLATIEVKNIRFLGIGGLVTLEKGAPVYFQNRDYIEGTEQAHEELKEILSEDVDVFVTHTPIRFFTDNTFEEANIRKYVCDYLPGKVVLTSQSLPKEPLVHPVTATDAALIKGGEFTTGCFWEIRVGKSGLIEKNLIKI